MSFPEYRDIQALDQRLFDVEAVGSRDVLEVDAADGRLQQLAEADHVFRILAADLQVEHIDVGKALEQNALPFHHRLRRQRANAAEPEHRGAVGDDGHQVAARRVLEGLIFVLMDLAAGLGDPGRVGERKVSLSIAGLRYLQSDFAGPAFGVIGQGLIPLDQHVLCLRGCVGLGDPLTAKLRPRRRVATRHRITIMDWWSGFPSNAVCPPSGTTG
jgi:hypothetical protein